MPFLVALALGAGLTPSLAWVGRRIGHVDHPSQDGLKIHSRPIPLTGGVGIVIAVLLGVTAAGDPLDPWSGTAVVLLLALGVVDDSLTLAPVIRLTAQVGVGVLLAVGGATYGPLGDLGPLIVVLAVPVMANAVNLMDGQDGLAAASAGAAASGMSLITATQGATDPLGLALVGALIAFLIWNRPQATVFLGDGGAYAVGGLLVLIAMRASDGSSSLLGSLICLGLFGIELVTTVVRRVLDRSSPMSGDRAHIYDLLARRLGGRSRSTLFMLTVGLLLAGCGWAVSRMPPAAGLATMIILSLIGWIAVRALWRGSDAALRRSG